jgi:hypothetical protein
MQTLVHRNKTLFFLLVILKSLLLSACGATPPSDSSGFCTNLGEQRTFEEKFEMCLQRDGVLAWFSEGPEVQRLIAAGRSVARIASSDIDSWETFLSKIKFDKDNDLNLIWDNLISSDLLASSISVAAKDDPRWDNLQLAIGKFQVAERNWKTATDDWADLGIRAIKNREYISVQERQQATKHMNKASEKMESIFDYEVIPSLKPFISSMLLNIGIPDETMAVNLTIQYLKNSKQ